MTELMSEQTKTCPRCKLDKPLATFKGHSYCLPHCYNQYNREYSNRNLEKIRAYKRKCYHKYKPPKINKPKKEPDIEKRKAYQREWQIAKYRSNIDEERRKAREYRRSKRAADINFRLADVLRCRLKHALHGRAKTGSSVKDLGCTVAELKKYLENKFIEGMTWDNWGIHGWHIDHIKPLASFDLTNPQQLCEAVHHTNLQPLWAVDNWKKSKTVIK
jgi:hypothetical protein